MDLVLLGLATFYLWETIRFAVERYAPAVFNATRVVHPLVVASFPLAVLWPDWIAGLAVSGGVGLLVAIVDRWLGSAPARPVVIPRRRSRGGLPDLP